MSRDLMHMDELKALVRDAYAAIDATTEAVAYKLYSPEELAHVPRSAIEGALGVGNHLRFATIEKGETILDLGCGAGIDSDPRRPPHRSRRAGDRARFPPRDARADSGSRDRGGTDNVETLEAEMEAIPLRGRDRRPRDLEQCHQPLGAEAARPRRVRTRAPTRRQALTFRPYCRRRGAPARDLLHPATWAG